MITDIVRLLRALVQLLMSLGPSLRMLLIEPLLTVGMLLALYAGWHVRDEGSLAAGLRVAFLDTHAYRAEHLRELETGIMQLQLQQTAQTDKLINQLLQTLLDRTRNAARVRLDVVHNGITGVTGTALLRYDVTNSVSAPGHSIGPLSINQPLSDWNDFLADLLAGKCRLSAATDNGGALAFRTRLEALGIGTFLVCPVIDVQARMLGAVLVSWDVNEEPPGGAALLALMDYAKNISSQIASALDLRAPLPYPVAGGE
jgi:hypothetical protein